MSMEYILHDDANGNYVLPAARLDGSDAVGVTLQQRVARTPGITNGYLIGDGKATTGEISVSFFIAGDTVGAAANTADTIFERARDATSLLRRTENDLNPGSPLEAWRALNGLKRVRLRQDEGEGRYFLVTLVFLPKFGRATVTEAETASAYDAATKTVLGGV